MRRRSIIITGILVSVLLFIYIRAYVLLPAEVTLISGQEHVYNFKSPFLVNIRADKSGMLKINDGEIESNGSYLSLMEPVKMQPSKEGSLFLNLKLFGLIPLRTLKVDIVNDRKVIPCGNTIGVKIRLTGILVVGVSEIKLADGSRVTPAKECGLRAGDLIVSLNGKSINSLNKLAEAVESSGGKEIKIRYMRGNVYQDVLIKPVKAADDKKYHLGLWVRDNTAGIGTLTFYDPETDCFAALGHGITDIDTGTMMPVLDGQILESRIIEIRKGRQGIPGELKGVFVESSKILGTIKKNCEFGVYGLLGEDSLEKLPKKEYPIGVRSQVVTGPAIIMANIEGKTVDEYDIEIIALNKQSASGSKGMVIKITDERLLNSTGGIVQGMSGSPIIQNGRIVGAVTHVMINDPSRGYGIFIESMIKNIDGIADIKLSEAV